MTPHFNPAEPRDLRGRWAASGFWGKGGHGGISLPWGRRGTTKSDAIKYGTVQYDRPGLAKALKDPAAVREFDPREIDYASQPSVTEKGVRWYLSHPDKPFNDAEANNPGNKTPVIFHDTETDTNTLLSGHHRATAAMLAGRKLKAVYYEGARTPLRTTNLSTEVKPPRRSSTTRRPVVRRVEVDLSAASKRTPTAIKQKYRAREPMPSDTVAQIAKTMQLMSRYKRTSEDKSHEVDYIYASLRRHKISKEATRMAVGLAHTESGYRKGTAHVPNARLKGAGVEINDAIKSVRDREVLYRASYLANAAMRMDRDMKAGATPKEAIRSETRWYKAHEAARRNRLESIAQTQRAAALFGPVVGWYLNPLLKNDPECIAMAGHNFLANKGTAIGFPGAVHPNCGCYAGPPYNDGGLVTDSLIPDNMVRLHPRDSLPKFHFKQGALQ